MRWCVDQAELLANDPQSITHLQDRERDRELTQQALSGAIQRYAVEKRYFHRSGRIVWVQLSVALVRDSDNNPRYFVGHIQDLSQQREMDRLKSEFVSMVSHELRTPLTSIVGSLGLVLGTTATDLPPNTRSLLDIAYSNTERLRRLIDDILDIDKITSGNMRFDLRPQSLGELTSKAVELNQGYAQRLKAPHRARPDGPELAHRGRRGSLYPGPQQSPFQCRQVLSPRGHDPGPVPTGIRAGSSLCRGPGARHTRRVPGPGFSADSRRRKLRKVAALAAPA